jgi:L-alanine-DL-glutamate epimerase-like enolase superfamily enzyme
MIILKLIHLSFTECDPVVISSGIFKRETYLVILTHEKMSGLGAANPFKLITGDTTKDVILDSKKILKLPLDPNKDTLKKLHTFLDKKNIKSSTLRSAVDSAYHDLLGQMQGIPVYNLYSKKAYYVNNSITVFLKDSIQKTQTEAVKIYKSFPDLKVLKIKLSGKDDIKRVSAIKKVSPSHMKFVLDANQAYKDPRKAVEALSQMNKILGNVILVEQPCPKKDLKSLRYIKDNLKGTMVFADEAATDLESVKKIVKAKAAHGVNIKLQKVGGIYPAIQIAKYCKEHGLKIMVGAMIEDTVGLTADAHFAISNSNLVLTDLDTDIDVPKYTEGGSYIKNGKRMINKANGLGIKLHNRHLEKGKTCNRIMTKGLNKE